MNEFFSNEISISQPMGVQLKQSFFNSCVSRFVNGWNHYQIDDTLLIPRLKPWAMVTGFFVSWPSPNPMGISSMLISDNLFMWLNKIQTWNVRSLSEWRELYYQNENWDLLHSPRFQPWVKLVSQIRINGFNHLPMLGHWTEYFIGKPLKWLCGGHLGFTNPRLKPWAMVGGIFHCDPQRALNKG